MTAAILMRYRAALGERFAAQKPEARGGRDGWLDRRDADRLAESLAEAYADAPRPPVSAASAAGLRVAAGFAVAPQAALSRALDVDAAADPATRRLSWRLESAGFGEALFAGAVHAALIGDETMLADPLPGLVAAARAAPEGWDAAGPFVESALRALATLTPLIDAGRLSLVAADPPGAAVGDPSAATRQRALWSAAIDALSAPAADASGPAVDAVAASYARLAAVGDGAPVFVARDGAAAPAARRFAEMAATAETYDLRLLDGLETASAAARRDALASGRWDGWGDGVEDLPRLDAPGDGDGRSSASLDLGPAPDAARLPLAEAVALALGDETFALRRALLRDAASTTRDGAAPSEELLDKFAVWRRMAAESLGRLSCADAFRAGWRLRSDLRLGAPLSDAATDGLAAVFADWPEQALIGDLAADAEHARRRRRATDDAGAPGEIPRRRGGSFTLVAPAPHRHPTE